MMVVGVVMMVVAVMEGVVVEGMVEVRVGVMVVGGVGGCGRRYGGGCGHHTLY